MRRQRISTLVLAIAVFPLVAIVGFQSAWAFACRIDGQVRDRCCCATRGERAREQLPDTFAHMKSRGCCDVSRHEVEQAPAARETPRDAHVIAPSAQTIVIAFIAPMPARVPTISQASARPPPLAPTFLDKRVILR